MKAVRLHAYGPPDVLRYEDAPRPEPAENDILVRVHAASVNAIDWKIRAGYLQQMIPYPLPLILGLDFSGTIDSSGSGPSGHKAGDEVYGRVDLMRLGTYAEYVIVKAGEFTAKPRSVDHVKAAAVPLAALTAWQSLFEGANGAPAIGLEAGQTILIHGAAGGVGSFAVQLAKWRGAHVIANVRAEDADFVGDLGADEVIHFNDERFEDAIEPVDAVLDLVGGDTQARSWQLVRDGGALATTVGEASKDEAAARKARAISVMAQTVPAHLDEIARLIDSGVVKPIISEVFPLAEAAKAHARLEGGGVNGKIVLQVLPD